MIKSNQLIDSLMSAFWPIHPISSFNPTVEKRITCWDLHVEAVITQSITT